MTKPIETTKIHIKNVIKIYGIKLVLESINDLCDEVIEENKDSDNELLDEWIKDKWTENKRIIVKCIEDWGDGYESWE